MMKCPRLLKARMFSYSVSWWWVEKVHPFFWYPRTSSCVGNPLISCDVTLTAETVTFFWFPLNAKLTFAKAVFYCGVNLMMALKYCLGSPTTPS